MALPIDPKDQGVLQQLDKELANYIKEADRTGKANQSEITKFEQQLQALVKNRKIPETVRQSLQAALQSLKGATKGGDVNLVNVISAKMEIDQVLPPGKPEEKK